MSDNAEITVLHYLTRDGVSPYREWVNAVKDEIGKAAVLTRARRLSLGLLGDWRSVGSGVFELRVDAGPGYRIYFGRRGRAVVILLCGGDKGSQEQDIVCAKEYWKDYEARS